MKTFILAPEGTFREESSIAGYLKSLGLRLIEVGTELQVGRLSGEDARRFLDAKELELVQVAVPPLMTGDRRRGATGGRPQSRLDDGDDVPDPLAGFNRHQ